MIEQIDQAQLNFNPESILLLNAILGLVMFGVALDLKIGDFRRVIVSPKGPLIGLTAQFFVLPAVTFLLTLAIRPSPSIALGMILVAACPGGNVSNFFTHLGGGNTALSVSMTAISTLAAIVMTPVNIAFWGNINAQTAPILQRVSLDPVQLFATIVTILGLPLFLGMLVAHKWPNLAARLTKPFKVLSIVFFIAFVMIAFAVNFEQFLLYISGVVAAVFLHNALALSTGYSISRMLRLPRRDARAVSIEVGIQNSALGLALIFDFFAGLGGMAIVAAWWGIWHLISGLTLACFWSRRPV